MYEVTNVNYVHMNPSDQLPTTVAVHRASTHISYDVRLPSGWTGSGRALDFHPLVLLAQNLLHNPQWNERREEIK